jgi:hypothetical protein
VEVTKETIPHSIDPAMHGDGLTPFPGITEYRCLADIGYLLNDIEFAEVIEAGCFILPVGQEREVPLQHVVDVAQPVVGQPNPLPAKGGLDTTAAIMPTDNDVLHLEHVDGELHHRETVEIRVNDHIGHIPVDEQLTRGKTHQFLGRNATVSATDPEILRLVLNSQILEKFRIPGAEILGPCLIVGKEVG